jgi:uncharacterized membrane protein
MEYWGVVNPPPSIHVHIDSKFQDKFMDAYQTDKYLKARWE